MTIELERQSACEEARPVATADQEAPAWLDAALDEFRAHRASYLEQRSAATQTLGFGATIVGLLVAGGFHVWNDRLPATAVFLVLVPLVCGLVGVQWSGLMVLLEEERRYLFGVEQTIKETFP